MPIEIEKCPWCGREMDSVKLSTHIKKCAHEGEKKIFNELKEDNTMNPKDPKVPEIQLDERNKQVWAWLPDTISQEKKENYVETIKGYQAQGYELQWMLPKSDEERQLWECEKCHEKTPTRTVVDGKTYCKKCGMPKFREAQNEAARQRKSIDDTVMQ